MRSARLLPPVAAVALIAGLLVAGTPAGAGTGVHTQIARTTIEGSREHVHLLRVDLRNPRVALGAAMPGGGVGFARQTVTTMATQRKAVAAVNGDFFDPGQRAATPVGGVIVGGRMLKSPRPGWNGNFYVTADRRAHIGQVGFDGAVSRAGDLLRPAATHNMWSVNTLADARKGRITLLTPAMNPSRIGAACSAVQGVTGADGTQTVTGVWKRVTRTGPIWPNQFVLLACGTGSAADWLRSELRVGDPVTVRAHAVGSTIDMLVSGGRQLVRHGRPFADPHGPREHGRNPATFVCVSQSGARVILGVVDGRSKTSRGLSYPELTRYLIALRCWDGLALDGGGSSTLVTRRDPARRAMSVRNRPSDGRARKVSSAILVYAR